MALSASLAANLGVLDNCDCERILNLLRTIGLRIWSSDLTPDLGAKAIAHARQHRGGTANLVLPTAIGGATFFDPAETGRSVWQEAIDRLRYTCTSIRGPEKTVGDSMLTRRMVLQ